MASLYPLFRLLWRPGVAWDLFVTTVFAFMLAALGGALSAVLFGVYVSDSFPHLSSAAQELQIALLAGGVVGTVVNFAVQDLLYCRFSWSLPGLGRDLRRGLVVIALIMALGSGVAFAVGGSALGFVPAAALTLAGFGLGNQLWDPRAGRKLCYLAQLLLIAGVVAAEPLERFVQASPLPTLLLALLVTATSVFRATTRPAARARALVPARELGASFRSPAESGSAPQARWASRRCWSGGPIADRKSWVRAFFYENAGWVRGGWVWFMGRVTLLFVLLLVLMVFREEYSQNGSVHGGLVRVFHSIVDPSALDTRHVFARVPLVTALAAMVLVLNAGSDLRRGTLYPLSRRDRADIVWRTCLHQGFWLLGPFGVGLGVLGAIAAFAAGVEIDLQRVPEVLVVIAVTAALLPILQAARVRLLGPCQTTASPVAYAALLGILGLSFTIVQGVTVALLRGLDSRTAALLVLGVAPIVILIIQLLFRRHLRRWLARADLV